MLLVIPISQADKNLVPAFVKAFSIFPPGSNHDLMVLGSPTLKDEAEALRSSLSSYFVSSRTETTKNENHNGWPQACNYYFQSAAILIEKNAPDRPFMWMELDCVPLKPNWLDTIHETYFADFTTAGKQNRQPRVFMGAEIPTWVTQGREDARVDGTHMNGNGVYPASLYSKIPVLRVVHNVNVPFDSYIQWYVKPHLNAVKLIQNNHKTGNYRREGDKIVCDSQHNWSWDIHFNDPVSSEAVVLHGCKDGSLIELFSPKEEKVLETIIPQEPVKPVSDVPTLLENKKAVKRVLSPEERRARSDRMKAMLARKRAEKEAAVAPC